MSQRLSEAVIGCAIEVHRALGAGFLERVYEHALALELRSNGVAFQQQQAMQVRYRGRVVGEYCCDFLIEGRMLIELKALSSLSTDHEAQLLNYLKATGINAGLLLNFGARRLGIKRMVMHHDDTVPV